MRARVVPVAPAATAASLPAVAMVEAPEPAVLAARGIAAEPQARSPEVTAATGLLAARAEMQEPPRVLVHWLWV
jgi:hypothetical protein